MSHGLLGIGIMTLDTIVKIFKMYFFFFGLATLEF